VEVDKLPIRFSSLVLLSVIGLLSFSLVFSACIPSSQKPPVTQPAPSAEPDCKGRDAVLCLMNAGLQAHYARKFKESNKLLAQAEAGIEDLFTKSLSSEAAALMINDTMVPYRGEDFESVMTNLFMALNYIFLGKRDDALVEARKVDNKLNVINARYKPDQQNVYKEDAFVRFVMGLLYESNKETNDAFISYRNAEKTYEDYQALYQTPTPRLLVGKLLAAAQAMGFENELNQYTAKYPRIDLANFTRRGMSADVYFLHYNGLSPQKVEDFFVTRLPDGYILKVAKPRFERRLYRIQECEIILKDADGWEYLGYTEAGEDIGSIAVKNLENRMGRIMVKAIARATAKYLAAKGTGQAVGQQAGKGWGAVAQALMNVAAVATEKADLRFWNNLPDRIDVAAFSLSPGTYQVRIVARDKSGGVVTSFERPDIQVKAGEKKFVSFRTTE